jgi:hypothetical protein
MKSLFECFLAIVMDAVKEIRQLCTGKDPGYLFNTSISHIS